MGRSAARRADTPRPLPSAVARRIWLAAQGLDRDAPFGSGPAATRAAVEHLGYVQIDTIHVIERCHHHILATRIPDYRRADLIQAQSGDRSVFEAWTHALAYVPTRDLACHLPRMKAMRETPMRWFAQVSPDDVRRLLGRIRRDGPMSIRDVDDDVLVEKDHPWASRKPSKRVMQFAFHAGLLAVSARDGMVKTYELMDRHFGWPPRPRAATDAQVARYLLERALRSQGLVSAESACYLDTGHKARVRALIDAETRARRLVAVRLDGDDDAPLWVRPEVLEAACDTVAAADGPLPRRRADRARERVADGDAALPVRLLSPFDPLVIQRRRLARFFGYEHVFEAYLPPAKRRFGYFALPVLAGDRIVAAIDLKADRVVRRLEVRQWTWVEPETAPLRRAIEAALARFETFQLL